jgi:purine-binding chemotaxis protein CheW
LPAHRVPAGGEEYALVIDQIKEVVITPKVSRIPLTPKYIKGVANVRGDILAIIDLEECFGLAKARRRKKAARTTTRWWLPAKRSKWGCW